FDTIYNDSYCAAHGLLDAVPPAAPDVIGHPRERQVSRWTRCTTVIDPRIPAAAALPGASA
ncbi:pyridoxal-5'-phosphate-dependent protein subunit beta, partial [Nocardia sp. NPDC004722]